MQQFIHLVVCLTTGPKPLPNRALHIVRSSASSFKFEYPLLSLRSSSSFLRFLPRLLVTSIPPCIFPLITLCRRQFLHKMWTIQIAFRFLISCRIFLCSLTLSNTSSFMQYYAGIYLLQNHSTCFGYPSHPSSGVNKTVTAACVTGNIIWVTAFPQRSLRPRWKKVVAQILWPVPEAAVTVLCTPDGGFDGHPKHVEWFCSK
jgi:hypothetical protein